MNDINLTPIFKRKMNARPRVRGRYNSSDLYAINHGFRSGKLTPEQWMHSPERPVKELLNMWAGTGLHNQIQGLLGGRDYKEEKKEFHYDEITVVAKADFLPPYKPDTVWEFKTSEKLMTDSKPWHDNQVKLYTTIFEKDFGSIYQPIQDADGVYLKHLKTVERDDAWFTKEIEALYKFHLELEKLWKIKLGA